jgi:hypothetical protein
MSRSVVVLEKHPSCQCAMRFSKLWAEQTNILVLPGNFETLEQKKTCMRDLEYFGEALMSSY